MSLDLRSVQLFLRAAATGGIGRAGREMGLSATAATQRLRALEEDLGTRLFARSTRRLALTTDGALFLEHATRLMADVEEARAALAGTQRVAGTLRVTASATFGRRYIAPWIGDFLAAHPDLRIELELTDSVQDMVERGFDLAIRVGALSDSRLVARRLAPGRRLVVAAPAYLARRGSPADVADLAGHDCLIEAGRRIWRFRLADGREVAVHVTGRYETNHGEAISDAARAGQGIAVKSLWDIAEDLRDGRLVALLDGVVPLPEWSIWAVQPSATLTPARVRRFVDALQHRIGRPVPVWEAPPGIAADAQRG
ncbi:LysR family transcriptional regulator [Tistrella mobilis]|jgi:DNA-binding transcriptional LysR family regulator